MPRIQYGYELARPGTRLRALTEGLKDARFALVGIGALLESASQRAFREERMGSVRWKTRAETKMVPNWPGILADFAQGRSKPPDRRFDSQHTLTDTGRLRGSIRSRVVSMDTVEVGSNVPYASVLHTGGESKTVPLTKALQERMWKWMKALRKRAGNREARIARAKAKGPEAEPRAVKAADKDAAQAAMSKKLGWLLNPRLQGQRLTVRHPPRPMAGLPKDIRRDIATLYGQKVRNA